MKKTFLVTCYFKHNYGSMLQSYATQRFLDLNNIPNETINVSNLKDFSKGKKRFYLSQVFNFKFIKTKFGMAWLKAKSKINRKLKKNINKRAFQFNRFKERYFRLTEPFSTYKELTDLCNNEAINVVVGSDQLWLPVNVVADYYTLSFVPKSINKISYATSFGVGSIPKKYNETYSIFLNRFNNIGVREQKGKELVESLTNKSCDVVCDPTLLLGKNEWENIIENERFIKDKYILCYFLGKSKSHRKFAEKIREITGYKIVSINHCDEFVRYDNSYADLSPYDVGPAEWLNLIKNAEYVCTDSFHGTIFSIIFNKEFFTFRRYPSKSKFSTNSRLDSLLSIVDLKNRLFEGEESLDEIKELLSQSIDYSIKNNKLNDFILSSKSFLLNSLIKEEKASSKNSLVILNKKECTGCTACMSICGANAIKMVPDKEGFVYPQINENKCINCGLCKSVCPSINLKKEEKFEQKAYLIRNLDEKVLMESTSGGAFTAFANFVLKQKGIVFGACFDENYVVCHTCIDKQEDVARFRNSKYVQSDLKETFREAKKFLQDGRFVLFSGTPCQIEALKTYLKFSKVDITSLYLADIVCHSVPSPLFWEKYKEYRKTQGLYPKAFRNKDVYGYEYSQVLFKNEQGKNKYQGSESDPYFRGFLHDLSIRQSCFSCKFKKRYRESDLTLWDCYTIHKFDKKLDDNKGVTRCLVHSDKGQLLVDSIKNDCFVEELEVENAVKGVREMVRSVGENPKRYLFFKDLETFDNKALFKKWFPMGGTIRIKRVIRKTLEKLGIYRPVKRFVKSLLGKQ